MGYYTDFRLIASDVEVLKKVWQEEIEGTEFGDMDFDGTECSYWAKWYDHNEDLINVSKKYPDVLFTLYGKGESSGDIWRKYYKNGKYQVAKAFISYEEFDEAKLKEYVAC